MEHSHIFIYFERDNIFFIIMFPYHILWLSLLIYSTLSQECKPDILWRFTQGYSHSNLTTTNSAVEYTTLYKCVDYCKLHFSDEMAHFSYQTKKCICFKISNHRFKIDYQTNSGILPSFNLSFPEFRNSKFIYISGRIYVKVVNVWP